MIPANVDSIVQQVVVSLRNFTIAKTPTEFQSNPKASSQPGLYAWWADEEAVDMLSAALHCPLPPLIYSGQTGATIWPSGKRSRATLYSRIKANHIGGNVKSSTFRQSLTAALRKSLSLRLGRPEALDQESKLLLSLWIKKHLRLTMEPYSDRDTLKAVEERVNLVLDPPLNLDGMPETPLRLRLSALRSDLKYVSPLPPDPSLCSG